MENVNTVNAVAEEIVTPQETNEANESTEVVESTESVESEVATGTEDVQSPEENSKFAEVRRKAEQDAQAKVDAIQEKLDALESSPSLKFAERQAKKNNMTVDEYLDAVAKQEVNDEIEKIADYEGVSTEVAKKLYEGIKLQEKTNADAKTAKEKAVNDKYLADFVEKHPDVKEVPQEVWDKYNEGNISLSDAYDNHARDSENILLKEQLAKYQEQEGVTNKNNENAEASTGSVTGNGSTETVFSQEQVKNMSKADVKKNYNKIIKDMKQWNK